MAKRSRTTNTILNFSSSIGGQLLTILMQFIVRTVFISTLGKSYLGINGLFSNILSMLSLVDLGMGSAILYKLYEPLAENNKRRITILMDFYKKAYRVIGVAVAAIGVCLIPFLPMLISDYDKLEGLGLNAVFIFCLYLFQSVSSYLFLAYRSAIIKADQKEYIVTLVGYIFTIVSGLVQIASLFIFCSFEIYVVISILSVIGQNVCCAIIANRKYPYLKEKPEEKLSKEETKGILKDCGALFLYRMNAVVMKATDNIVLSAFMGLDTVALYSNYYIFYTTIKTLFAKIFNSVSHSLGNLHASDKSEHEYEVFEAVMFVSAILGGVTYVGIFSCADEFIRVWIGTDWVLVQPFSLLMGLEIYTMAFRSALSKYRSTMGLFRQSYMRPVAGMVINLVVSIALVNVWGICGVLVGTIAADWLTFMWLDPLIVHKYGFEGKYPIVKYYLKFMKNFLVCSAVAVGDYFLCLNFFTGHGWLSVIVHIIICAVTATGVLMLASLKSRELNYLMRIAKGYAGKLKKLKK